MPFGLSNYGCEVAPLTIEEHKELGTRTAMNVASTPIGNSEVKEAEANPKGRVLAPLNCTLIRDGMDRINLITTSLSKGSTITSLLRLDKDLCA